MGIVRQLLAFIAAAFLATSPALAQEAKGPLVFAAASLTEAMNAAADAYVKSTKRARPVLSFGASSALARQIEAGGAADLFVSADEEWMDYLAERQLVRPATRATFLTNRLVLVVPADEPLKLAIRRGFPLATALGDGRLAMADPASVPAGKYGQAALTALGVWTQVEPKVVRAENVRSALAFVARGAARAGIVYATDAQAEKGVTVVGPFPPQTHPKITYPLAVTTSAKHPDAARFRTFLVSPAGRAIFQRFGFGTR